MNYLSRAPQLPVAVWSRLGQFLIPLILVLNGLAALALGVYSYLNPVGNWDIVPYTALVRASADKDPASLSQQTYSEAQDYLGEEKYQQLITGGDQDSQYGITLHAAPAALIANLRFYSVKPLYIFLSRQVAVLTNNAAAATVMVSAAAFCLFVAISPLFFSVAVAGCACDLADDLDW